MMQLAHPVMYFEGHGCARAVTEEFSSDEEVDARGFPHALPEGFAHWAQAQTRGFTAEQFMQEFGLRSRQQANALLRRCTRTSPATLVFVRSRALWRVPLQYEEFEDWVTEEHLRTGAAFTANDLSQALGVPPAVVVSYLNRMQGHGLVRREALAQSCGRRKKARGGGRRPPRDAWVILSACTGAQDAPAADEHISVRVIEDALSGSDEEEDGAIAQPQPLLMTDFESWAGRARCESPAKRKRSASLDRVQDLRGEEVLSPARGGALPPIGTPRDPPSGSSLVFSLGMWEDVAFRFIK